MTKSIICFYKLAFYSIYNNYLVVIYLRYECVKYNNLKIIISYYLATKYNMYTSISVNVMCN